MNKTFFKILPFLLLLAACSKKNIPQTATTSSLSSVNASTSDFVVKNTDFLYFTSKSNFNYKDNDENISATANLRMKKDSVIWINVTPGLGVEAMRAIITPDSIVIVDKIKKQYVVYDFKTLSQRFNFNLSYKLIEDLILGNQVKEINDSSRVVKEGDNYVLIQKEKNGLIESYVDAAMGRVQKVVFAEPGTSNQFIVEYKNIPQGEEKPIPNTISMALDYTYQNQKYTVSILVEHLKSEFSEKHLKFPFNIPTKYERVE